MSQLSQVRLLSLAVAESVHFPKKMARLKDVDNVERMMLFSDSGATADKSNTVPLLLIPGSAQGIDTWSPHVRPLIRSRRLIIPELRCHGVTTTLLSAPSTVEQLASDIQALVEQLGVPEVDLCGFSLGGRVALAYSVFPGNRVRRVSVTGVPLKRPPLGRVIIRSWLNGLENNELNATSWSFVLNGYSDAYITRNHDKVDKFVKAVVHSNSCARLRDLFRCSLEEADHDAYSVINCASRITCPLQIVGGALDRISDEPSMMDLHQNVSKSRLDIIMNSGHLAPFEYPAQWRNVVLDFLS